MTRRRVRQAYIAGALWVLFTVGSASAAHAQGEVAAPDEKGVVPNRDYLALLPFEVIDTASNNLILRFTDLELPGNAGRSLRIERVFSNSTFGIGWRMGIAGVPMRVVEPLSKWLTQADFTVVPWDLQHERRRTPSFQTLEGGAIRTTYWTQPTIDRPRSTWSGGQTSVGTTATATHCSSRMGRTPRIVPRPRAAVRARGICRS